MDREVGNENIRFLQYRIKESAVQALSFIIMQFAGISDELVYCVVQGGKAVGITAVGPGDAVLYVILEYDLCGAAQGRTYGCKLDQHVGAVLTVLHHLPYMLKMAYRPCKPVQNSFSFRMYMRMRMVSPVFMCMFFDAVAMHRAVAMVMIVNIVFVHFITVCQFWFLIKIP